MQPNTLDDASRALADAHINLSNDQARTSGIGQVCASMMLASARFAAYISAKNFGTAEALKAQRDDLVVYFAREFQSMLASNLDDYIQNFSSYVKPDA